ncbi:restriction endonuclease [Streptomyces sp. NPDC005498]|uniref:restriction endonuclease n=1 Tax=Streptomyces sp. NPDC005498 TaxID=3364717 RepID=UPI00367CC80F
MTSENPRAVISSAPPSRRQIQSWQDAERNAAAWMRHWGFSDAEAKPGGADGGIGVRSRRALGQVKYQAAAVGRPELQNLFGARGRNMEKQLFFFTGSSYAATAVEYADNNSIALFVYALDGAMTPVNETARRTGAAPAPLTPTAPRHYLPLVSAAPATWLHRLRSPRRHAHHPSGRCPDGPGPSRDWFWPARPSRFPASPRSSPGPT